MSRAPRRQIDFNKPLIQIDNVEKFCENDVPEPQDSGPNGAANAERRKPGVDSRGERVEGKKKENIIIPVIKKVENPLAEVKQYDERLIKKRKPQGHYIRYTYCKILPNPDKYELSDKDIEFLTELNNKIEKTIKNPQLITNDAFEKIYEAWEHETAREEIISLSRAITLADTLVHPSVKDFVPEIYQYWKKCRENYKRPMLRRYLKVVNKDDNNPNAAFRTRENPKMKTRRAQKANDAEGLQKMKELKSEMEIAITLLGNIKYRELVKLEILELNNLKFEAALRFDGSLPSTSIQKYKDTYENDSWTTQKNKFKEYNKKAQNFIQQFKIRPVDEPQPEHVKIPVVNPTPKREESNKNFDATAFMASLVEQTFEKNINPQSIEQLLIIDNNPAPRPSINPEPIPSSLPHPRPELQDRTHKFELHQGPNGVATGKVKPMPVIPEEKNIWRYKMRRRYDRYGRIVIDKIFEEDENDFTTHHRDFYEKNFEEKDSILTYEIVDKIHNNNLHGLYVDKFGKFNQIYPFHDSDDDQDLQEFNRILKKNLANNFRAFIKQRKNYVSLPANLQ